MCALTSCAVSKILPIISAILSSAQYANCQHSERIDYVGVIVVYRFFVVVLLQVYIPVYMHDTNITIRA